MTDTSIVATPEAGFWKHGRTSLPSVARPWPARLSGFPGDHHTKQLDICMRFAPYGKEL